MLADRPVSEFKIWRSLSRLLANPPRAGNARPKTEAKRRAITGSLLNMPDHQRSGVCTEQIVSACAGKKHFHTLFSRRLSDIKGVKARRVGNWLIRTIILSISADKLLAVTSMTLSSPPNGRQSWWRRPDHLSRQHHVLQVFLL